MKKIYTLILLSFIGFNQAQTTFWTENFGTGCTQGNLATAYTGTNGAWTQSLTGTNDGLANKWFVSATEAGMGVGNCGSGCVATPSLSNRTLHISMDLGSNPFIDIGAGYAAGAGANTNKRAQSPTINCSAATSVTMSFNYIMWGVLNQDYMQVMYSADNGVTWTSLGIPPQTPTVACSGQGIWTSYSVSLPASANNNATVKIGFRWQNINANGADPSCAVDDIVLKGIVATPSVVMVPTFSMQNTICMNDSVQVVANTGTTSATGYTWTGAPSGVTFSSPNASTTMVYFSTPGSKTISLTAASGTVTGSTSKTITVFNVPNIAVTSSTMFVCIGNSATLTATGGITYTWNPGNITGSTLVVSPTITTTYTVIGTQSFTCKSSTTAIITATNCGGGSTGIITAETNKDYFSIYPNPLKDILIIKIGEIDMKQTVIQITSVEGKIVLEKAFSTLSANTETRLNISELSSGVYFVNFRVNNDKQKSIKVVKE